ncbi:hypothetical protein X777_09518, partial [Ooceraea biroi]
RSCYFCQLTRSYPILKLVDIYDRQSFIRAYVLDNVHVCILMYILLYAALWYANYIIQRIEKSNQEMSMTVADNKMKLDKLLILKNKKAEFQEVIVKTADAQKLTTKYLEDEMHKLSTELITTSNKIVELERIIEKVIILEPSFPPSLPPEPPPRKYGIFLSRPPGQRRTLSAAAPATALPKLGFK